MKKRLLFIIVNIVFIQISLAQKGGLVMDSAYGEELYIRTDSTMIMSYSKVYSNHKLKKDSIKIVDDIEVYLSDVAVHKESKKYTYYVVGINEISYNRNVAPENFVSESYITRKFTLGKEWEKVVFSSLDKIKNQDITSVDTMDCIKFDEGGYRIVFEKLLPAANTFVLVRENTSEQKVRLDEYTSLDCSFFTKHEPHKVKNIQYAIAKELVIFHYIDADFFSLYYQWKK